LIAWKRRPIELPLTEIEAITVAGQAAAKGKDAKGGTPEVLLKSGQRLALSGAGSAKDTTEAVRQMCAFLSLPEPEIAATPQPHPDEASAMPQAEQPKDVPAADQAKAGEADKPAVAAPPSRAFRWAIRGASLAAALFLLVMGGSWVVKNWFTLPGCD